MMRLAYAGVIAGALVVVGCQSAAPLFNGQDLSGWVEIGSENAWQVRDGILHCTGEKTGYAWLSTDRTYGDFVLEFDWRIEPEGNTGVFLRAPDREGRTSMKGFEVQARDDATDETLEDVSGAVFRRIPAAGRFSRPVGEWNHFRLTMRGRRLLVELNGKLASDTDLDTVPALEGDPPMSAVPNEGYIGLQNHGSPCNFRNVVIRELR